MKELKVDYFRRTKRDAPVDVPKPQTLHEAVGHLFESERTLGYHHPYTRRLLRIVNRYRFGDK